MLVEIQIQCPHCGETITTNADTSQGDYSTIEDCEVCCAPMNIDVACEPGEVEDVRVTPGLLVLSHSFFLRRARARVG